MKNMKSMLGGILLSVSQICWAGSVGGVGSGGGNVQQADQLSIDELVNAVQAAKPIVAAIFQNRLRNRVIAPISWQVCEKPGMPDVCDTDRKLFDAKPNVFDVIDSVQVDVRTDRPCVDLNSQPTDGSMFGQRPGSVCVSVFNLKQKLRADNSDNQITALLVHEISHLLGTTEPEAVALQWAALDRFAVAPVHAVRSLLFNVELGLNDGDVSTNELLTQLESNNGLLGACSAAYQSIDGFQNLEKFEASEFLDAGDVLTSPNFGMYLANKSKLQALADYVCSLDPAAEPTLRASSKNAYELAFRNRSVLTAKEYSPLIDDRVSSSVIINRIADNESLLNEARSIRTLFDAVRISYLASERCSFPTY